MTRDFFSLEGLTPKVSQLEFAQLIGQNQAEISNLIYAPNELKSTYEPWRQKVIGAKFCNISFKNTIISNFEFEDCEFQKCLLTWTVFQNCRFTHCKFIDCNPHRVEFQSCYVDPQEFVECISSRRHANVGVYLFQEILRNSKQQVQPDFSDEAQYHFRKWQRHQRREEIRNLPIDSALISAWVVWLGLLIFDKLFASGMHIRRVLLASVSLLIIVTILNWQFADAFDLQRSGNKITSLPDAFYFSTIVVTSLGFGDITPVSVLGKIFVSLEAVCGFVFFALLTSTLYRRLSA